MFNRPTVMMVTDRHRYGLSEDAAIERVLQNAGRAARAGVDLIQVREHGLDDRRLVGLVTRIVAATHDTRARVVVNERTDVAMAAGARGVHLRSTSPSAARVRTIVPPGFVVGRSIHSRQEALGAEEEGGCDYLVFGTVFASGSKPAGHGVAGAGALGAVCSAVQLPVLAIGGITAERAVDVASAGAAGIAAIELFARDDDDDESVRRMIARIRAAFNSQGPAPDSQLPVS
jgi:thiamine-phosphate pyrophosphorylase